MRRLLPLLALPVLLGLVACDRTDRDYGEDGVVRIGVSPDDVVPVEAGELAGHQVVMGHIGSSSQVSVALVRPDGTTVWTSTLPASFAAMRATGVVVPDLSPRSSELRIYVVGDSSAGGPGEDLQVAKLNGGGAVDTAFGDGGIASTGVAWTPTVNPLAVTPTTGSIMVAVNGLRGLTLVRLDADGALDADFGDGDGVRDLPYSIIPSDMARRSTGGGVLIGGTLVNDAPNGIVTDSDMIVIGVKSDGNLDSTFARGGAAIVTFNAIDRGMSLAVQRYDDVEHIVIAGTTTTSSGSTKVALGGIEPSGRLDLGFGYFGRSIADFTPGSEVAVASGGPGWVVATSGYGRVVTLGFQRAGALEDTWGEHGTQVNDVGSTATPVDVRLVNTWCLHGSCDQTKARFVVAAKTDAAPGGVLVGLKP